MSLSWNDPQKPDQVCMNQSPWVSRAPDRSLDCSWGSHPKRANISLPFKSGLLVIQVKEKQLRSSTRLHGTEDTTRQTRGPPLYLPNVLPHDDRKWVHDKRASPTATCPPVSFLLSTPVLLMTVLVMLQSTARLTLGAPLRFRWRKWQPCLEWERIFPKRLITHQVPGLGCIKYTYTCLLDSTSFKNSSCTPKSFICINVQNKISYFWISPVSGWNLEATVPINPRVVRTPSGTVLTDGVTSLILTVRGQDRWLPPQPTPIRMSSVTVKESHFLSSDRTCYRTKYDLCPLVT